MDLNTLLLGSVGIIAGVSLILGSKWVNSRSTDTNMVNKKLKLYKDTIEELEDEIKHWKGKFNKTKQLPTVTGEFDLSNDNGVEALIKEILPNITNILPPSLQGLARDPKIVDYAMKLYRENPEKAKELFNKFIRKSGKDEIQGSQQIPL